MIARCRTASCSSAALPAEELRRAANFLNEHFSGRSLSQIRQELVQQLKETRERLNQVMLDAIEVAQRLSRRAAPARTSTT